MANTLIDTVMKQLQHERARLEDELHRVSAALTTFGQVYIHGTRAGRGKSKATGKKRAISAAARISRMKYHWEISSQSLRKLHAVYNSD